MGHVSIILCFLVPLFPFPSHSAKQWAIRIDARFLSIYEPCLGHHFPEELISPVLLIIQLVFEIPKLVDHLLGITHIWSQALHIRGQALYVGHTAFS